MNEQEFSEKFARLTVLAALSKAQLHADPEAAVARLENEIGCLVEFLDRIGEILGVRVEKPRDYDSVPATRTRLLDLSFQQVLEIRKVLSEYHARRFKAE